MYYDLVNISNPLDWFLWINTLSGGNLGIGIVGAFWVVLFISMKNYETEKAFATASFMTTILCFLMWLGFQGQLVTIPHLFLTSILTLASLFILKKAEGGF